MFLFKYEKSKLCDRILNANLKIWDLLLPVQRSTMRIVNPNLCEYFYVGFGYAHSGEVTLPYWESVRSANAVPLYISACKYWKMEN